MMLRSLAKHLHGAAAGVEGNGALLAVRAMSTAAPPASSKSSPLSQYGGVHGSRATQKTWRNKPLFRREGDARFRTGAEAAEMLINEVKRRDSHEQEFVQVFENAIQILAPVFERIPKYAFVGKEFIEPERIFQFRVSWLDDSGTYRMNRGFRVQYSSALGPFEGGLHFHKDVNAGLIKSMAFARVFTNALTGCEMGAAVGGADFNPMNKSEAEIQRFCQAYMTELSKYIGPDQDLPGVGTGVGAREIGYLGVAHWAKRALEGKGETMEGKRCLITGSGKMALHVAEKLLEMGAIPITLSDTSGHIYEPDGLDAAKLKTIMKIKSERGARIGRYIIASTTAKYNEPENVFSVPADLVFPCATHNEIDGVTATMLADMGVRGVFEGSHMPSTNQAIAVYKKRGILHGGHVATMAVDSIFNGLELSKNSPSMEELDGRIKDAVDAIYLEAKATAKEFNVRGDLHAGAIMAGFLRVADTIICHGAV
ncbi:glutamate dehydrogenase [Nannochloropsis oceanica]